MIERYFHVLMHGIKQSIAIRECDVPATVAQLMENNGETPTNIFVFCRDMYSTRLAMDELYSYCLENTVYPAVCDRAQMKVTHLEVSIFFKRVPQTLHDISPIMGMDASVIFTDEYSTNGDALQFLWSRIRPRHSFSVEGTMLADALNWEEV